MEKVSKPAVNYRKAEGDKRCGNCGMFHPHKLYKETTGSCDLVLGLIHKDDTCDEWVAKNQSK